jgi:hypothetical protein
VLRARRRPLTIPITRRLLLRPRPIPTIHLLSLLLTRPLPMPIRRRNGANRGGKRNADRETSCYLRAPLRRGFFYASAQIDESVRAADDCLSPTGQSRRTHLFLGNRSAGSSPAAGTIGSLWAPRRSTTRAATALSALSTALLFRCATRKSVSPALGSRLALRRRFVRVLPRPIPRRSFWS